MRATRVGWVSAVMIMASVLAPHDGRAQGLTANIAGVVRDTTGGVLPGVTVEASSPALIEKVRTVVTDGQGQYRIVDLRPGTYTVTFTLTGFSVVTREGLELTTGFTATANANLSPGSLEETITVTGASPVVDVQNVRTQRVIARQVLDSAPIAGTVESYGAITVGASGGGPGGGARDIAGAGGEAQIGLVIRGERQGTTTFEGLRINRMINDGSTLRYAMNRHLAQEIILETSGASAETEAGGLNINIVLRDGGNVFHGLFDADYSGRDLQSNNISDELRARGVNRSNVVTKLYDVGGRFGGPVRRDSLWFYTAHRKWGGKTELAGVYFNQTPNTLFYTPDVNRPGFTDIRNRDNTLRLTWQATAKDKIAATAMLQSICYCRQGLAVTNSPEASYELRYFPNDFYQVSWTEPATSRLLFEAGGSYRKDRQVSQRISGSAPAQPVIELSTGLAYGERWNGAFTSDVGDHRVSPVNSFRAAASYITGSHAFKTGMTLARGTLRQGGEPSPVRYQFRNQLPVGLDQVASPNRTDTKLKYNLGFYGQDQWTAHRLTLNVGVRLDLLNEYVPPQVRPAGLFLGEFRFDPVYNVPNWKDISPRLGAAYDLFGDGKTAVKMSVNRYVNIESTIVGNANNPAVALAARTTRTWNDANRNFFPDCDLTSRVANGECGPMANSTFGTTVITTRYAPDVLEGWGVRPFNWQASASLSHELLPGMSVEASYFRTWHGNFRATQNRAVTASDFDSFCVAAPVDSRLPGGGGYQVCNNFDVKPSKFGQTDFLVTQASNFGEASRVYNGYQAVVNGRFGQGGFFTGGVASGRTVWDSCAFRSRPDVTVALPAFGNLPETQLSQHCHVSPSWSADTQVKFTASYPFPWGVQASAVFQNLPGADSPVTLLVPNPTVAPSLGRNLAACGTAAACTATVIVPITEPWTRAEQRQTQLDLRISKEVGVGQARVRPRIDIYNLFNANSVQSLTTRYGPTWLTPGEVLTGRLIKVGAQFEF